MLTFWVADLASTADVCAVRLQHQKGSKSTDLVTNLEVTVAAELWKRLDEHGREVGLPLYLPNCAHGGVFAMAYTDDFSDPCLLAGHT
jgi:hypothetical protein